MQCVIGVKFDVICKTYIDIQSAVSIEVIFSSNWHVVSEIPKVILFDINAMVSFTFSEINCGEQTIGKQRPTLIAIPPCVLWMMPIKINVHYLFTSSLFTVASAYVAQQNEAHHLFSTCPRTILLVHCVSFVVWQNFSIWMQCFPCNIVLDSVVHFVLNENIGWRHQIHKSFPKRRPTVIFPMNPKLIQKNENN